MSVRSLSAPRSSSAVSSGLIPTFVARAVITLPLPGSCYLGTPPLGGSMGPAAYTPGSRRQSVKERLRKVHVGWTAIESMVFSRRRQECGTRCGAQAYPPTQLNFPGRRKDRAETRAADVCGLDSTPVVQR